MQELKKEFFQFWLANENLISSDACNWWLAKFQGELTAIAEEVEKLPLASKFMWERLIGTKPLRLSEGGWENEEILDKRNKGIYFGNFISNFDCFSSSFRKVS